jgi:calcineurin-like phosphoesterase family protein
MATFFISDMHFGESQYTQSNYVEGRTLRRPFADAKEMDEAIIQRWNETVSDGDRVWVLGDMGKSVISKLKLLRGEKNLVAGNIPGRGGSHDHIGRGSVPPY